MKIYYMDCNWAGSIVVIANSVEEAHKLAKDKPNYFENGKFEEHEIVPGLVLFNLGDL